MLSSFANTKYKLLCAGAKTPTGELKTPFKAFWIDEANANAVIQSSPDISYFGTNTVFLPSYSLPLANLMLSKKVFNAPNLEATYYFSFTPTLANLTTDGRLYLEYSVAFAPRLNRLGHRPLCWIYE